MVAQGKSQHETVQRRLSPRTKDVSIRRVLISYVATHAWRHAEFEWQKASMHKTEVTRISDDWHACKMVNQQ